MADKYIIEGAAFNGDGTSSAEATSNGGVGAWNTITYFEGATPAYGSIAAGDTVYIRSKTAAGADIVRVLAATATLGSTVAVAGSPVTWILDGGSIWSGVTGILRYECPSTFVINQWNYNNFIAEIVDAFQVFETFVNANQKSTVTFNSSGYFKNWLVDLTAGVGSLSTGPRTSIGGLGYGANPILENIHWRASNWYSAILSSTRAVTPTLLNPDFEILNLETSYPVLASGAEGGGIEIYGGQIRGAGATSGLSVFGNSGVYTKGIKAVNFKWPRVLKTAIQLPSGSTATCTYEALGADEGGGAVLVAYWGEMSSRVDNNPPTLNAYLPDSSMTPWSWLINARAASRSNPAKISFGKYYTQEAAQRVLTVEFLLSTANVRADRSSLWLSISYTDQDGSQKSITTHTPTGGALDVSSAPWSSVTWGAISFNKRKLEVTTPTPIKKDSLVSVTLSLAYPQENSDDILFVCPDVGIL